jgi:hypothetical protein
VRSLAAGKSSRLFCCDDEGLGWWFHSKPGNKSPAKTNSDVGGGTGETARTLCVRRAASRGPSVGPQPGWPPRGPKKLKTVVDMRKYVNRACLGFPRACWAAPFFADISHSSSEQFPWISPRKCAPSDSPARP